MKVDIELKVRMEIEVPDGMSEEEYNNFLWEQFYDAEVKVDGIDGRVWDVEGEALDTYEDYQWLSKMKGN